MKFYYLVDRLKDSIVCVWQCSSDEEAKRCADIAIDNIHERMLCDLELVSGFHVDDVLSDVSSICRYKNDGDDNEF